MSNSQASSAAPNLRDLSALAIPENEQIHLPMNPVPTFDSENNEPQGKNEVEGNNEQQENNEAEGPRRGRPRGSKNKPKEENDSSMHAITLQVPDGVDLIEWVVHYANSRKTCIVIMDGRGLISHVTLNPMTSQPPQTFAEPLTLTSLTGNYVFACSTQGRANFRAVLDREDGSVIAGEPLMMITMGPVELIGGVYKNPEVLNVSVLQNGFQA